MKLTITKSKIIMMLVISLFTSLLFIQTTKAEQNPTGDIVQFAPVSNWYTWFIRSGNETGQGQKFLTTANTEAINTVAFKLCRLGDFTKPKTLTLCNSATSGWYAGCQTPIASKEFSASELNEMINHDINCYSSDEGGADNGLYYKWTYFTFDDPVSVLGNTNYFVLLNSSDTNDNENGNLLKTMYNNSNYLGLSEDYTNGQAYYYKGANRYTYGESTDIHFKVFSDNPITTPFDITSHDTESFAIEESWITVTGTCPIVGENRIGFTNDCLGFEDIEYNVSCVNNEFSGEFYKSTLSDRLIAREISSVSGDCADFDNLMDYITLSGLEVIEGYPDDWYFNFDYYNDYDIKIKSPIFDTALTLPIGSTSADFTFGFIYPTSSTPNNLNFNIKQYDSNGNLLNASYHNKDLSDMASTWNHTVTLTASSTQSLHYVVQLTDEGEMTRQYPFGIFVSDMDFVYNSSDFDYFFPRLVEMLKTKIVFNYYFAFHDGFYDMFNGNYPAPENDDLDITFKSVSADGEYDLDITIFSASDARVKSFASGVRPYVVAILWLMFATYVVVRVTHLFSSDNE
jgi:hypothetical protein